MLIQADCSCLLIIDIQEKLLPHVQDHDALVKHTAWLMQIASELKVPMLVSEQYPRGLGPTVEALRDLAPADVFMDKIHFSCVDAPECLPRLAETKREQFVLTGIEAHVCVLQTALGLIRKGHEVFVVADAISSRGADDVTFALARMRQEGVRIVSREMVAFEWLHKSGTPEFKDISRRFLR